MGTVTLVAHRELVERLRARSFLISTGVYLAVAMAVLLIPHFLGDAEKVYGIGVSGPSAAALEESARQLAPTLDITVRTRTFPDAAAATAAVRSGAVDVAIVDTSRIVIFAAAGAAASRPEDIGNATAPITVVLVMSYIVAVPALQDPDGTVARVASFIPFMAPMTMLPRSAVGNVAAWEVPVSMALVLLTTWATVRLGARVYAGGLRRPGPRLKLREAWRAASG